MPLPDFSINGEAFGEARIADEGVELRALAKTDWFFSPNGQARRENVISVSAVIDQPVFTISAHVAVDFAATYDAGALFVKVADDSWAKLAFEYSAAHRPTIVSVVTRGTSDDCDGPALDSDHIWLRVYRNGQTLACHYYAAGKLWHFVRFLTIPGLEAGPVELGLGAQSPTGSGVVARFTDLCFGTAPVSNLRDGQ